MFQLSEHSISKLEGVHPDLVAAVKLAITLTTQDFTVVQGLRTLAEEQEAVATGHSKTLKSRHLTGHAVDLAPVVNGAVSWDWAYIYPIVRAMEAAGQQLCVAMNWGGCWDMKLGDIGDPQQAMKDYDARWQKQNTDPNRHGPLLDGPHFQLTWEDYPVKNSRIV